MSGSLINFHGKIFIFKEFQVQHLSRSSKTCLSPENWQRSSRTCRMLGEWKGKGLKSNKMILRCDAKNGVTTENRNRIQLN